MDDYFTKKRERNLNFSQEEAELVVMLADRQKNVIESKKSDNMVWKNKEFVWTCIEKDFNSCGVGKVYRSAKHLKSKYEALKRDLRKKLAIAEENKLIGGPISAVPPLTPIEERIRDILLSVNGEDSAIDSDCYPQDSLSVLANYASEESREYIDPLVIVSDNNEIFSVKTEPDPEPSTSNNTLNGGWRTETAKEHADPVLMKTEPDPEPSTSNNMLNGGWRTETAKKPADPVLSKRKQKRPFEKLTQERIKLVAIQKQIAEEELEEKRIRTTLLRQEMEQSKEIFELKKRKLMLKIELLSAELVG